ncbi:MAG: hypothetical protein FK732_01280 [Asgard group archaeon]|nr:hypothetical protein [Asgard group archaeon]
MDKSRMRRKPLVIFLSIFTIIVIAASITTLLILKPWEENGVPIDYFPVIGTPSSSDPYANSIIQVNVGIIDDFGVDTVILSFTTDMAVWQNISMTGIGTTNWMGTGNIPAQDIETTIN